MTSSPPSPPLPLTNFKSKTLSRTLIMRHLFSFSAITLTTATILYRALSRKDAPMALFIAFSYFLSFTSLYCFHLNPNDSNPSPKRRRLKLLLWALLCCAMLGFGCAFAAVLSAPETLCFFGVVAGGSAFLYYAYLGKVSGDEKGEAYATVIDSFVPIMIMFFGLGRSYLTPLLIIHVAIMNGSKL